MTENVRHVIQPVELFLEEDEKINFVFHMNKKSLMTCVALFHQESSENVVVVLVLLRENHC